MKMDKDICGPAAFPALTSAASPHILLVNPWIHDFAAYDFWANPLGLLTLGAMLRQHGARISYVDCLDRFHPRLPDADHFARFGRGPYHENVHFKACRNGGYSEELLPVRDSARMVPIGSKIPSRRPDLVLVTSMMTYWYPGVQEAISIVKSVYPDVPVILGGIYATLCQEHAIRFSGADLVIAGPGETQLFAAADKLIGWSAAPEDDPDDLDAFPFPAADLQRRIPFAALLTSTGCPFSCAYCASGYLNSQTSAAVSGSDCRRNPVLEFLLRGQGHGFL